MGERDVKALKIKVKNVSVSLCQLFLAKAKHALAYIHSQIQNEKKWRVVCTLHHKIDQTPPSIPIHRDLPYEDCATTCRPFMLVV